VTYRKAILQSLFWVFCALFYALWLWSSKGSDYSLLFLTSYLIEKSLSVDNLVVFALVFQFFRIPIHMQHRVLFWGIISAVMLRGILIFSGISLVQKFHWILYIFGGLLILVGIKTIFFQQNEKPLEKSRIYRFLKKHLSISDDLDGQKFWTQCPITLKKKATPLLAALIFIEMSDVIFAVDSIPAVFAVTTDPLLIWTSNIFAILGLRSLYFLLIGSLSRLHYLSLGLGVILCFVGVKMLGQLKFQPWISLLIIVCIMLLTVLLSFLKNRSRCKK
jgi:tellurite resistance protein TerC